MLPRLLRLNEQGSQQTPWVLLFAPEVARHKHSLVEREDCFDCTLILLFLVLVLCILQPETICLHCPGCKPPPAEIISNTKYRNIVQLAQPSETRHTHTQTKDHYPRGPLILEALELAAIILKLQHTQAIGIRITAQNTLGQLNPQCFRLWRTRPALKWKRRSAPGTVILLS